MAAAPREHLLQGELGHAEEPGQVDTGHRLVVRQRVLGERLGDEYSGIVDQRVDAAEMLDARGDHALGRGRVADIPLDGEHVWVCRRRDVARRRDYSEAQLAVRADQASADALRCAGDDGDLLSDRNHDDLLALGD